MLINTSNTLANRKEEKVMNKKKKGFTLIELIVVIAILGILAAIAIPQLSAFRTTATTRANIATSETIGKAAQLHLATLTDAAALAISGADLQTATAALLEDGAMPAGFSITKAAATLEFTVDGPGTDADITFND